MVNLFGKSALVILLTTTLTCGALHAAENSTGKTDKTETVGKINRVNNEYNYVILPYPSSMILNYGDTLTVGKDGSLSVSKIYKSYVVAEILSHPKQAIKTGAQVTKPMKRTPSKATKANEAEGDLQEDEWYDKGPKEIYEMEIIHRRNLELQADRLIEEASMLTNGKEKDFPDYPEAIEKLDNAVRQLKTANRQHPKLAEHKKIVSEMKSAYAKTEVVTVGKITRVNNTYNYAILPNPSNVTLNVRDKLVVGRDGRLLVSKIYKKHVVAEILRHPESSRTHVNNYQGQPTQAGAQVTKQVNREPSKTTKSNGADDALADGLEDKDLKRINEDEISRRGKLLETALPLADEAIALIKGNQKDYPEAIKRMDDAVKHLELANQLHPKLAGFKKSLSYMKRTYARQLFDRAYEELKKNRMSEAEASLKDSLKYHPKLKSYVQAVLIRATYDPKLTSRAQALLKTIKSKNQMKSN